MKTVSAALLLLCLLGCAEQPAPIFHGSTEEHVLVRCSALFLNYLRDRQDYWTISYPDHGWKLYSIWHEEPIAWFFDDGSCGLGDFVRKETPSLSDQNEPARQWIPHT